MCVLVFVIFIEHQQQSLGCGVSAHVLHQLSHLALPLKAMSDIRRQVPHTERSEFDLPPGVAHARTVCPAAGRHHGDSAGGTVWANQPQVVLRGRRCDITVHGHSSGWE